MPDKTPDPAPTAEPKTADELLQELTEVKATLSAEREASEGVRQSFVQAINAASNAPAAPLASAPEPEPEDIPTSEDFDEDHANATARLSATMIKRGLSEYDHAKSAENAELRDAVLTMEWDRVRTEDPKNFDRLSKHINAAMQKPGARRPGAIRTLFYQLRGQYMPQLQEMDRQDKSREPVVDPNPPVGDDSKAKPVDDVLNAEEILVIKGMGQDATQYFRTRYSKDPKFADGYLRSLGLPEAPK